MTASRRGLSETRKERLERDIRRTKGKITEFESIIQNKDHPVLVPFLKQLETRLKRTEIELDESEKLTELQVRLLLNERLLIRSLLAFDDLENALPTLRDNLDKFQKELEGGD